MISLYVFLFTTLFCVFGHKHKNIVIILTDDQDINLNSMSVMSFTQKLIANEGATFTQAFVTTPVCCPSRSTILTGQYSHNHGTTNNSLSGGCAADRWRNEHENNTFANILHSKKYITFYAGKYLNQYGTKAAGGPQHVPVGWDWWIGLVGNSRYYNYSLSINGTERFYSNEYLTDVINDYAMEFLKQKVLINNPFLMMLSTPAPHAPFTPADRHKNLFPHQKALKTPAFNATQKDKHWIIRMPPSPLPANAEEILDSVQKGRLQTLIAVDEMVNNVITTLDKMSILNETFVLFTSDNGFHVGQFCQMWDKRQPYDTDISVPLFVRGPNVRRKTIIEYPVANIDLAPTILAMAGFTSTRNMDGFSFLVILRKNKPNLRYNRKILIEYNGEENTQTVSAKCPWKYDHQLYQCSEEFLCKCQDTKNNSYIGIRHISNKINRLYCEFLDSENFIEVYDLNVDPYQLNNLRESMAFNKKLTYSFNIQQLKKCAGVQCHL